MSGSENICVNRDRIVSRSNSTASNREQQWWIINAADTPIQYTFGQSNAKEAEKCNSEDARPREIGPK